MLRLLFPGFFDEKPLHSSEIKTVTAELLDSVLGALEDEIRKSLEYNPPADLPKKNIPTAAHNLTVEFLGSLPRLREVLQTDIEAAYDGDPAAKSKEEVLVSYPFVEAIAVQRLAHELYLKNIALIPRIMTEWAHARTGMDLHPGAQIGSHFFVDHCTGTVVGETTIIGDHVKMYHGVRLGANPPPPGNNCAARNGIRPSKTASPFIRARRSWAARRSLAQAAPLAAMCSSWTASRRIRWSFTTARHARVEQKRKINRGGFSDLKC